MVEKRVPLKPTLDDALSYIRAVKETFRDKPEKYREFIKMLMDLGAHIIDQDSAIAKAEELLKDHQKLLLGFRFFLPKVEATLPSETNKGLGQFHTMVGKRVSPEQTMDDAVSYITSAKEAFHDEPAKYDEFIKLLKDVNAHRVNRTIPPEAKIIIHPKANRAIPPEAKRTIPPEAKIIIHPKANRTIPPEAKRTIPLEANKRIIHPKTNRTIPLEAKRIIHPEPNRTIPPEANKTIPLEAKRIIPPETNITTPLEAKRIIHPGANRTIPPEAKRIIHSEAEKTIPPEVNTTTLPEDKVPKDKRTIPLEVDHPDPDSNNKKGQCVDNFMKNLETRFQSIDTHVVESFGKTMKEFKEGKMSILEVQEEVGELLYYHEDLIEEFSTFLPKYLWHKKYSQYYFSETKYVD